MEPSASTAQDERTHPMAQYLIRSDTEIRVVEINRPVAEIAIRYLSAPQINQWLDFGEGRQLNSVTALLMVSRSPSNFIRALVDPADRLVGIAGLQHIDSPARSAMLWGLRVPLRPPVRNFAAVQVHLLLRAAFHELGLQSVYAWVAEPNRIAMTALEAVGFRCSGRQRRAQCVRGKIVARLLFDILDEEYFAQEQTIAAQVAAAHSAKAGTPDLISGTVDQPQYAHECLQRVFA